MRVKEEVQKSRDKDSIMIHNSKLAQMGEMMSMIAHQWRQPLSAISAASTGLQIKIELDRYDEKLFLGSLEKIEEYVYHLSQTIDDFADFFKPSKRKEKTSLDKLVDKALFILSSSFTKNSIEVETSFDGELELETYSNEVIQVLINLLKNAETILLKREIQTPKITLNCYAKGDKKYIEIADNAGGIEEDIIDKIFESYFTTKENDNSTGLGLYMSKFIIEDSCKGKLEVKNENGGAKFTIVL
jgi:signal transduction histidine kinase